jgi:hypothetical protein
VSPEKLQKQRQVSEDAVTHIIARLRWATTVFLVATFALVAGLAYTVYGIESVESRVAAVEASPCVADIDGPECQAIFSNAFENQTLDQSCVGVEQALIPSAFSSLTRCPK